MVKTIDGITFRTNQDLVDVALIREPDPNWKFTDKEGHIHVWRLIDGEPTVVASCKWITDAPATDEYPSIGHAECRRCDQHVDFGWRAPLHRELMPGLRSYFINDEEVKEEEYMKLWNEVTKRC